MTNLAINIEELTKVYRNGVRALSNVQMQVPRGEIFGLLGPNGAGKSTLVKSLMTIVRPTQCRGTLLDKPIGNRNTFSKVGYLPEHVRFPEYLTGSQILHYTGGLNGVPKGDRSRRAEDLLKLVGMESWKDARLQTYSKGMKQRIGIAQALINDPEITFLDEPTDGVDPVGRREIRDILLKLREQGKTVFVNSHLLSELERVSDRVAILVGGEVRQHGTMEELTTDGRRYEIRVHRPLVQESIRPFAATLPEGVSLKPMDTHTLRIDTADPEAIQPLLDAMRRNGDIIVSVQPYRQSLEDLFMQNVEGGQRP